MADPLTLTLLGAAATEGIKFLYSQASEVIAEWRRRREPAVGAPATAEIRVPIVKTQVLDAAPADPVVDLAVLDRQEKSLVQLLGALSPYALGQADVDPADDELQKSAGRLRALLEAVYGQRFTFRGEQRDPTGSRITVSQVLGDVQGRVVGARATVGPGGDTTVSQQARTIGSGAEVVGFEGTVGSHPGATEK
jgi:MoxR-like ATPase